MPKKTLLLAGALMTALTLPVARASRWVKARQEADAITMEAIRQDLRPERERAFLYTKDIFARARTTLADANGLDAETAEVLDRKLGSLISQPEVTLERIADVRGELREIATADGPSAPRTVIEQVDNDLESAQKVTAFVEELERIREAEIARVKQEMAQVVLARNDNALARNVSVALNMLLLIGALFKLPDFRLDRRLKRLQIQQIEYTLNPAVDTENPNPPGANQT